MEINFGLIFLFESGISTDMFSRLFTSLTSDPSSCPMFKNVIIAHLVYLLFTTSLHLFPLYFLIHHLLSPLQVVCGQNCTFVIQPNGTVLACGEGSYGRLGQGNSDDLHVLTVISALQGAAEISVILTKHTIR